MNRCVLIILIAIVRSVLTVSAQIADTPKINSIVFEGNEAFSDKELRQEMATGPDAILDPSDFEVAALENDLEILKRFYHREGFLSVTIIEYSIVPDSAKGEVTIHVRVNEGPVTRIDSVSFSGNQAFSTAQLSEKIPIANGEPLRRLALDQAAAKLLEFYGNAGYLDVGVKMEAEIDSAANAARVRFDITEHLQYTVGEISLVGLERTRPEVVLRELEFRSGEVMTLAKIKDSQVRLYETGLFRSVFVRPLPSDSLKKDVLIELRETDFGEVNFSVGYGTIDRLRLKAEFGNTNLKGTARKAGIKAEWSSRTKGSEVFFTEPYLLGWPLHSDLVLKGGRTIEPAYTVTGVSGWITVGRKFLKRSVGTLTFELADANYGNVSSAAAGLPEPLAGTASQVVEYNATAASLNFGLFYDGRNNILNPSTGIYTELSAKLLQGTVKADIEGTPTTAPNDFVSVGTNLRFYVSPAKATTLASGIDARIIRPLPGTKEIVLFNERYYAGGPNDLRAFEYQKVGPLDANGKPVGGRLRFVWNALEVRQTLYKIFGGVVFAELGNVWAQPEEFNWRDMRVAVGAGLRLLTPIGVARLDYGINPSPQSGEPGSKLYLGIGQAF